MNFKTTTLLFGVLLMMLCLFGIIVQLQKERLDESLVFPTLTDPNVVGEVLLTRKGQEYRFVKKATGWQMNQASASQTVRIDDQQMEKLIEEVGQARKAEGVTLSHDRRQYDLTSPERKVVLKEKGGGREWTLNLGKESPDNLYVYAISSDRPNDIVAVPISSLQKVLVKNIAELRSRTLLDVSERNAKYLKLTRPGDKDKAEIALEQKEGLWLFREPATYGVADFAGTTGKDEPGVKGLLNGLGNLRVEDVSDFEPPGKRPADYGLADGKENLRIDVKHTTLDGQKEVTQVLLIGKELKDQYFARLEGEQSVVRVSAAKLKPVFRALRDPATLRSRDLIFTETSAVDRVDVRWGPGLKKEMQLGKLDALVWKVYAEGAKYRGNETAIAGDKGSLLTTLRAQGEIKEFKDAASEAEGKKLDTELGLDIPVAEVKLFRDGMEKKTAKKSDTKEADPKAKKDAAKDTKEAEAERGLKKDAAPAVTLLFGKTVKDLVWVKRIDDVAGASRVAVPAAVLEKLTPPEGALAYVDDTLPGFSVDAATKLELVRASDKFVAEQERDKDKKLQGTDWLILEPKDLPGRTKANVMQVRKLLDTLVKLKVVKWVSKVDAKDAASKKALEDFGLAAPSLSAIVTVEKDGDKADTIVYQFGKDAADDKTPGVYALMNKTDLVFLAQPTAVKALTDAELRDLTVFTFDRDKAKEVKLNGWQETANFQVGLSLERKSKGVWTASGLKGFDLDNRKANELVAILSQLKATKYVVLKGGPQPLHKLADNEAKVKIEVMMDDSKTTHTLVIGAMNADKTGYYAQSNALPGVVFVLPRDPFEAIVSNYSWFSRNPKAAAK